MYKEIITKGISGYVMLLLEVAFIVTAVVLLTSESLIGIPFGILAILMPIGFVIIAPNESKVLTLFGKYKGTIRSNGFGWVNPFYLRKGISLRARNHNGQMIKVNDKVGNPIEIAAVVVWEVKDTAQAAFEVDDYLHYILVQSEAAVRQLASSFPYDHFEDEHASITLRDGGEKLNETLEKTLNDRLERAGIHVLEARISHLAYATEIAAAMLQRQQATAIVAARKQIVDGAVGMVEMALARLSERQIVNLDEEKKAAMVSNLLVVLCSDRAASPVVNAGTLNH
ncbi:MAG TPA: SPFH domain-containing protein [Candidatus Kapabacteria bacterium]